MAESTLSITYTDLQEEVGRYLGWNETIANWTATNTADFLRILKGGLRKFYLPGPPNPGEPEHQWSFLRVNATITLAVGDADYDLPDACDGRVVDGSVGYASGANERRLSKTDEAAIRMLQANEPVSGTPVYYAVRAKAHAPTTGQRYEMLVYPTPSQAKVIHYSYQTLPDAITSTNIYPHGGAAYSQVILEAILSEAERLLDDDPHGPHQKRFELLLGAAIAKDKRTPIMVPSIPTP